MIINDLSFLNEVSSSNVAGASGGYYAPDVSFKKRIDIKARIDIKSRVYAKGAQNELSFDLTALGRKGSGTDINVNQTAVKDSLLGGYASLTDGFVLSYAR